MLNLRIPSSLSYAIIYCIALCSLRLPFWISTWVQNTEKGSFPFQLLSFSVYLLGFEASNAYPFCWPSSCAYRLSAPSSWSLPIYEKHIHILITSLHPALCTLFPQSPNFSPWMYYTSKVLSVLLPSCREPYKACLGVMGYTARLNVNFLDKLSVANCGIKGDNQWTQVNVLKTEWSALRSAYITIVTPNTKKGKNAHVD